MYSQIVRLCPPEQLLLLPMPPFQRMGTVVPAMVSHLYCQMARVAIQPATQATVMVQWHPRAALEYSKCQNANLMVLYPQLCLRSGSRTDV